MNKTKILICGVLPPPYFGHSMLYKALLESAFVEEFDVIFFNMKFWSYEKHKRVTPAKLLKFVQYYFQFAGLIIFRRPRYVLYAISFDKMPFLKDFIFCMTARVLGCKVILHDMGQYLRELYGSSAGFLRGLIRFLLRNVHLSIVLGDWPRKVYQGFMDMDRVYAVPGAVWDSASSFPYIKRAAPSAKVRVLFFSFLQKSKGVWVALESIPKVIAQNPDVYFIFAGPAESADFMAQMKEFVNKNNLEQHFEYVGYVGDEEKRTRYFREADIFIFPTLRDVFGLVLLHAMAESCPVIASLEGAISEIVIDGQTGFLVPKGDCESLAEKILLLAKNPQTRVTMGQNGRKRYEEFYTLQAYAGAMGRVFNEIRFLK